MADRDVARIQKGSEPRDPLIQELAAVRHDKRVYASPRDDRCGHHGLSEPGRGRLHARFFSQESFRSSFLLRGQRSAEGRCNTIAGISLAVNLDGDTQLACKIV